jgi:Cu/Ag efflux protein CusF
MGILRWLVCILAFLPLQVAAAPIDADASDRPIQLAQAASGTSEGEIRDIDRGAKTITIKHQAIKGLDMPAMTMAFQVKDAKVLDQVKAGDRISFRVEQVGNAMIVTEIRPAK